MKLCPSRLLITGVLIWLITSSAAAQGQRMTAARQAWDYKVLLFATGSIDLASRFGPEVYEDGNKVSVPRNTTGVLPRIKELGDEGWELVSVTQTPAEEGRWVTRYYFKRPK
jgi:hypothetical protein